jgi:hypothetical protein
VEALQSWARTADSDLYIAEALLGTHLGNNQSLQDVLSVTVGHTETGLPYLIKGVNQEVRATLLELGRVNHPCGTDKAHIAEGC